MVEHLIFRPILKRVRLKCYILDFSIPLFSLFLESMNQVKKKKFPLHLKILLGMVAGIAFGAIVAGMENGKDFVIDWIKPWGTIFVNLLKLIAIPLIVASLLKGILDLKDISKFARIGGRSILMYVGTTIVAITIGLLVVNIVKPGGGISEETINTMTANYAGNESISSKMATAEAQVETGPLAFVVDMVPSNIFKSMSNNGSMLQVIFFVIFFGLAMLLVPPEKTKTIKSFFDGLNDVVY